MLGVMPRPGTPAHILVIGVNRIIDIVVPLEVAGPARQDVDVHVGDRLACMLTILPHKSRLTVIMVI